jgi:hypothetical protein
MKKKIKQRKEALVISQVAMWQRAIGRRTEVATRSFHTRSKTITADTKAHLRPIRFRRLCAANSPVDRFTIASTE